MPRKKQKLKRIKRIIHSEKVKKIGRYTKKSISVLQVAALTLMLSMTLEVYNSTISTKEAGNGSLNLIEANILEIREKQIENLERSSAIVGIMQEELKIVDKQSKTLEEKIKIDIEEAREKQEKEKKAQKKAPVVRRTYVAPKKTTTVSQEPTQQSSGKKNRLGNGNIIVPDSNCSSGKASLSPRMERSCI